MLDDNVDILDIVREVLTYEDFEVRAISEARDFMHIAKTFAPHLILLDFRLKDGHGGELCRAVKSDPAFHGVPVIIFTAYAHPDVDFNDYGSDALITKPFSLEGLTHTIKLMLPDS